MAQEAPGVELKLAALAALREEEALRQALRTFRHQDKRLHRAAKSRWQAAVAKREADAEARVLIAGARALSEQERIPANRLVELDRAWEALSGASLDEALLAEFQAVRAELGAKVRERGVAELAIVRGVAAADAAMHALTAGLAAVARGAPAPASRNASPAPCGAPADLAAVLLELLSQVPGASGAAIDARCTGKIDAANRALALASSVVQRAEFLHSLPAAGLADEADEKARIEQWRGFPEVPDEELQALLARRFSDWRNASGQERQREREARRTHEGELNAEQRKRRLAQMQRHVEAAEAAQAAGQVEELTRLIGAIDEALKPGPVSADLARRIESLRAEQQRLRAWQRWSGGQRREELVAEAQALAGMAGEKLVLKAHAEAIDKLRERWKELDKLGGATSKTLWLAFDGALKAAYAPVAAHLEKLKAARKENLAARNRLIDGLAGARAKFDPAAPDWRALARTVEEARIAWRRLGPVEHTVPREAQKGDKAVAARYAAALQALEGPLGQAYREAGEERKRLIGAAQRLGEAQPLARDAIDKVRALQAQWQAHAKALPLPRREESALWSAFKAATDAVFSARDAARAARDTARAARESQAAEHAKARAARESESKRLREAAAQAAQARFDALIAAMGLCAAREAAPDAPDLEARWSALEGLPAAWKTALEPRFRGTPAKRQPLPELLLKLEVACELETPGEFMAARRQLKLLALKTAMEDRRAALTTPADIERWLLEAAATARPDEVSRARLEKIIAGWRRGSARG